MSHYDTLEVVPHASAETIRAAYRSLMQRHHPDKHPGDAAMAARAAQLTQAYEVLSEPARRAAYDQGLARALATPERGAARDAGAGTAAAAAEALAARRARLAAVRGQARPPRRPVPKWLWVVSVTGVVLAGLWWGQSRVLAPPTQELASLRRLVEAPDTPEAQRRELLGRKEAWMARDPTLRRLTQEAQARDRAARAFVLIDTPLRVVVGGAGGGTGAWSAAEIEIPEIDLIVGSFESARTLAHLDRHRARLVRELGERLAREDASVLARPYAREQLTRIVLESVNQSIGADARQEYPSTWWESPGRHGVAEVVLRQGFELLRLQAFR